MGAVINIGTHFEYKDFGVVFAFATQNRNNFLISAMLKQTWHCAQFVVI